jgi:ABC-type sugar transport system ATPase subunit
VTAAGVELVGVGKRYADADRPALEPTTLAVAPGAFFSVLGPSGCGKTTMLRIIAGFEAPAEGRVLIGGEDVTGLRPRDRGIAMVFQDYALYPHMTVEENMTFNLRNRRVPRAEIAAALARTAGVLHIEHLLGKRPRQLSGGERQRVALGRALIRTPRVFLMDEPLSNLDLKLREAMRIELGRLHQEVGITVLYVTHDQSEAMTLSTELAILERGRVQQSGAPAEVYARPQTVFVARFIGSPSMNILRMVRRGDRFVAGGGASLPVAAAPDAAAVRDGEAVLVGVRAHHLVPVSAAGGEAGLSATVTLVEHLGRSDIVVLGCGFPEALHEQEALQMETEAARVRPGEALTLSAVAGSLHLFRPDGRRIAPDA